MTALPVSWPEPSDESGRIALFERFWLKLKLTVPVADGLQVPGANSTTPPLVGVTSVTFIETAVAVDGMPQKPVIWKVRGTFALSAGPPCGPFALRVSSRRQGARVNSFVRVDGIALHGPVQAGVPGTTPVRAGF